MIDHFVLSYVALCFGMFGCMTVATATTLWESVVTRDAKLWQDLAWFLTCLFFTVGGFVVIVIYK